MSNAAQAYARTSQNTSSPREIEAQALLKAARQLRDVQDNWTGPGKNLHDALHFNRQLW
jgi:flagellar biosynthesis activator protein FlaF